ncbi:hypothetical protein Sango_2476500 [Sesamum angolense]|uniref:Integrase zinc-binding domain-containing protein n=1 Tax=Sesamum angolense TaxID=2727404 RepID=A0AAE2BHX8_9LAMI|nr:hypothetical protein Sango_2476500 [Sesamum angolense]
MHKTHYAPYAMHPGSTKMYRDLRPYCWWPTMKKDVVEFVVRCLTCQQVKAEHQAPANKLHPLSISEWKWEKITMDFAIELPCTFRKHDVRKSDSDIIGYDESLLIEFRENWDDHLPLMKYTYDNSSHSSIGIARMKLCMEGNAEVRSVGILKD